MSEEDEYTPTLKFGEDRGVTKKRGCTAGRIVNACIICNYFLLLLSALIVAGTMGVLHNKLRSHQDSNDASNRTCILFSKCVPANGQCQFHYNNSGGCDFIIGGFVIIAFIAICYIVVSVFRIILSTTIWLTVVADILVNLGLAVVLLVLGITVSVGLAVSCGEINKHYGINGIGNCSAKTVPAENGYPFYNEVSVSQGAAWFCFMFSFFGLIIFLVRSFIFCRRRATVPSMPQGSAVLKADDNYKSSENSDSEKAKAI